MLFRSVGRVLTVTRGSGTSDASTTTYAYDAAGHLLTETLDAAGLNIQTAYAYDAFGNRVKVTDPRGNSAFFYYDALNRLVLQVDPQKYATETTYSRGDQVASVTHYMTALTGTIVETTKPTPTANSAIDEVTTITRDKLDRVTGTTDATGATESYTLNAFGDRVSVTNKLGGVTTNVFDKRGLLTRETLPVSSYSTSGKIGRAHV